MGSPPECRNGKHVTLGPSGLGEPEDQRLLPPGHALPDVLNELLYINLRHLLPAISID